MTSDHQRPNRGLCAFVLLLPIVVPIGLIAIGKIPAPWELFSRTQEISQQDFFAMYPYFILSSASWIPLLIMAWKIRRHENPSEAPQQVIMMGTRDIFLHMIGRTRPHVSTAESQRPRPTKHVKALGLALVTAAGIPGLFLFAGPLPKTPGTIAWLIGAGILFGISVYSQTRASEYLTDAPGRWDFFRNFRLLDPKRYDPAGHKFVRWQLAVTILLPIWWLGGGALMMSQWGGRN